MGLYYCFGEYDGVVAGSLVLAALSGGHLKATKVTKLLSISGAMAMMSKAGSTAYAAPKG
jgi:hypothetical protein